MRRRDQRRRKAPAAVVCDRGGFTLVEVLIVLVIITIGILPLAVVQTRARQEVFSVDRHTQALALAQRQLEWTRGMGFANAVDDSGTVDGMQWSAVVQDVDMRLRRVSVMIVYTQGTSQDTLRVASLISER
jgi:prepilin-type N-terminal cleavage/methylation domain-containing protein